MTFVNSWAFWFFAVSAPVVLLYFFRIRRRRQDVPNLAIWRIVLQESKATFLLKRIRRILSLLLQLLIMSLLIFALGKPVADVFFGEDEYLVLVIDCSASMQVLEDGTETSETRFALAMKSAREIIKRKADSTQAMIVSADRDLNIICPFTDNARKLSERLEQTNPTIFPTDINRACLFAADMLRGRGKGRIILLSDGAGPTKDELKKNISDAVEKNGDKVGFTYFLFGKKSENIGITNFSVRKNEALKTDEILMAVKNFSDEEKKVSLEYYEGDVLRKNIPVVLAPNQKQEKIFSTYLPAGGILKLKLNPSDDFAPDDVAYTVVRPEKKFRLVLVAPEQERFFFVKAFNAMEQAVHDDSMVIPPDEYSTHPLAPTAGADLTIFNKCTPPENLPPGTYLFVDCDAPQLFKTGKTVDRQVISDWDRDHPINRFLSYHGVVVAKARQISEESLARDITSETKVIIRSPSTPLVLVKTSAQHKIIYIGFDVQRTVLPFRIAFPTMLRNILTWSHYRDTELFRTQYATGDIIRPLFPILQSGRKSVRVTYLKDDKENFKEVGVNERGYFHFTETDAVAPYKIEVGERVFFTSVNLSNPQESAIAPKWEPANDSERGLSGTASGFAVGDLFTGSVFWIVLTILSITVLLVEWMLFHRRITE